jgi:hypothetical protein
LYDLLGRTLQTVLVSGDYALLDAGTTPNKVFIVQVLSSDGKSNSVKVKR